MAFATVRQRLTGHLTRALDELRASGYITTEVPAVRLEPPKQEAHGDFACTVALALAKPLRKNPREIATRLQEALGDAGGTLEKTEIAGPGFLNLFVADQAWRRALGDILEAGDSFARSNHGAGIRVLVEFVSANPTGPLHIAHGRGAVTGDVIARLLTHAGYQVEREYYINDLGNQADIMAHSIHLRYCELHGKGLEIPEEFYPGEYIIDIAKQLNQEVGDRYIDSPPGDWLELFRSRGIAKMVERIREDLAAFGIEFDNWVSEREMTERTGLMNIVDRLAQADTIYEQEGKRWFRTTDFGDDKDRVVVREDGRPTYFASDIAYHDDKMKRGFHRLLNVFGADHGGYVARVRAGMAGLGYDAGALDVVLIQMVSLSRGGEAVRMGKRLGTAVWLRDVVDEVGRDATRYFFVLRRSDAQLEFDLELATRRSLDNPVYYAQMGHARMCSIERRAQQAGVERPELGPGALDALVLPEEIGLIKKLLLAPDVIVSAAQAYEPHQLAYYIQELIGQFHSYFTLYKNTERVISDNAEKTRARLLLCRALRRAMRLLLEDVLGVAAPERMVLDDTEASP